MRFSEGSREGLGWALAMLASLLFLLVNLATATAMAAPPQGAVITAARVGGDDMRTRFVTDLTSPTGYSVYVLPDPWRVVIDLKNVRFDLPPDAGSKVRGLISEYRYGEVEDGRARIVLDTQGPVLIEKSFIVEAQDGQPARIVVDIARTTEAAFRKTYKADNTPKPAPPKATPPVAAAKDPDGRKVVVIDPGHGGIDGGAVGVRRTKEKDVVLAFGLALREALKKSGNYKIVMTRSADEFVSLRDRVRVARDNSADLFIAIHADTVRGQSARGATIYTLSDKASDAEAEALAQKENSAGLIGGIDFGAENEEVTDILFDLVQRESKQHSMYFAKKAHVELRAVTAFTGKPLRSAGFVVLKAPDVPSVLVELGYLSSKSDEQQLNSVAWRNKTAAAMARAVDKYFSTEIAARTK